MSSARERRNTISEERRFQGRESAEELLEKYRPIIEEIGGVVLDFLGSTLSDEEDSECHCGECSCSNETYDPIGDRVSRRALAAIDEVASRWANDPDYNSDDAMDAVCNVLESLGD